MHTRRGPVSPPQEVVPRVVTRKPRALVVTAKPVRPTSRPMACRIHAHCDGDDRVCITFEMHDDFVFVKDGFYIIHIDSNLLPRSIGFGPMNQTTRTAMLVIRRPTSCVFSEVHDRCFLERTV